jgi:hypothetical protein
MTAKAEEQRQNHDGGNAGDVNTPAGYRTALPWLL